MFSLDKLLIIIVLYKEHLEDASPFKAIRDKNLDCFVYDNSPTEDTTVCKFPFVKYIHDPTNPGVSTAYNKGAEFAQSLGKEWVLLFDQDTKLPTDFVEELLSKMKDAQRGLYAMRLFKESILISPCGYKYKRGYSLAHVEPGRNSLKSINFLNSGLLISLDLFYEAGGYDVNVPLYFSDFIFVNRLRKVTDYFVLLPIDLHHNLSSNDMSDPALFKVRYDLYLKGVVESIRSEKKAVFYYYAGAFLRAFKLTLFLKDSYYLTSYWKKLLNN